ncbi:T9SS type A sorting domain-containing protein [Cellulophaga tyrosinoxydans]|uniref:Por secretion system C-terminal sorting domain-containing protein n=1 Tax=Cellulophaga tyrosinoxydans TaxID=504486 RepID=A0A1W2C0B8_9FLAO|nr:T9SS type A sorting domain-containing protein [Cellulophaga tyrosinoxydans]SMC78633.1 Por secretion system C-terminal sorting domain-containing protein [Cellulophaga tyrosinoxydans]
MKIILFTLFLFTQFAQVNAQDKLAFKYDTAGNQTSRQRICLNCTPSLKTSVEVLDSIPLEALVDTDLKDYKIAAYPNPVVDELYMEWIDNPEKMPTRIQINSFDGRVLHQQLLKENQREQIVDFSNYASGVYVLTIYFTNDKKESIKIIKK